MTLTAVMLAALTGGGAALGLGRWHHGAATPAEFKEPGGAVASAAADAAPQTIRLDRSPSHPATITAPPPERPSALFPDPRQAAVTLGQGFSLDAERVLEVSALQISLLRYRAANGRFPQSLADLFPAFAPADEQGRPLAQPPVDPVTHQPYRYTVSTDGLGYQLEATLSNGKRFAGVPHPAP